DQVHPVLLVLIIHVDAIPHDNTGWKTRGPFIPWLKHRGFLAYFGNEPATARSKDHGPGAVLPQSCGGHQWSLGAVQHEFARGPTNGNRQDVGVISSEANGPSLLAEWLFAVCLSSRVFILADGSTSARRCRLRVVS